MLGVFIGLNCSHDDPLALFRNIRYSIGNSGFIVRVAILFRLIDSCLNHVSLKAKYELRLVPRTTKPLAFSLFLFIVSHVLK